MTTVAITPMNAQQSTDLAPKPVGLDLKWDKDEKARIKRILACYPNNADGKRSAIIPLLWLAQHKCGGWLPVDAMQLVAETVEQPYIRVYEVATFYTMYNLEPIGKFHVQVCTNCSCLIRGSDAILQAAKDMASTAEEGTFTVTEVECLGACVAAPMMQVGTHYFTKLDAEKTKVILDHLAAGGDPLDYADTPSAAADPVDKGEYKERV